MKNLLCCLILLLPVFAAAHVTEVREGGSLQQAIAAASPGDTVRVLPGTYREYNIAIDKPLVLLGAGFPVVDGGYAGEILVIKSPFVTVSGLHFMNVGQTSMIDWAAVKVLEVADVTVSGNRVTNSYFGIYLSAARRCTVADNEIHGTPTVEQSTGNGIHAWKCDSLIIRNNTVSGHRDGIYFEFVTNSHIEANNSHHNIRYGLHFMFSHRDAYYGNTFRDNGAGVAVMYSHYVDMQHNLFEHNWGSAAYGILLKDISDSQIQYNRFVQNTTAITMEGTSRIAVEHNQFSANGWAMRVQASCMDSRFAFNNFIGNTFDVATNGNTVLNTFDQNYWDKYEGYDLDHNGYGDVPYHPVSLFSSIIERMPPALVLLRSFVVTLLERAEKIFPSLTPEQLIDQQPSMKPLNT